MEVGTLWKLPEAKECPEHRREDCMKLGLNKSEEHVR